MKKLTIYLYYFAVSLIFTIQSVVYINDPGDQTRFAATAREIGYDYLGYAVTRYQTWSSRLLIESATMLFSVHHRLFTCVLFLSTFLLFYGLDKILFAKGQYPLLRYASPLLFLLLFPSSFYTGAGLIATVTNYYFPLITLVLAYLLVQSRKTFVLVLAVLLQIFSVMQEQLAVVALLFYLFLVIMDYLNRSPIDYKKIGFALIALAGVISVKLSPGNAIRTVKETATWYPEFKNMGIAEKIYKGFMNTNNILFSGPNLLYVMLLLVLVLVIVAALKKHVASLLISSGLFLLLILNYLNFPTLLSTIQKINPEFSKFSELLENKYTFIYPILIYTSLLFLLAYLVLALLDYSQIGITASFLLVAAYIGRMLVSLSPTIHASGVRTFQPVVFAVFLVIIILLKEVYRVLIPGDAAVNEVERI
ncbi:hypothetical protein [Streptococcus ferus]|uniref:hypothetical protein n=1 Tax=Streptococcus ferus TaxID=1345 RepID=UPI0035A14D04